MQSQILILFLFVGLGMGVIFVFTEQQSIVNWQESHYEQWLESQVNDKTPKESME